jgi:hypothetical protein
MSGKRRKKIKRRKTPLVICGKCKAKRPFEADRKTLCKKKYLIEEVNVNMAEFYNLQPHERTVQDMHVEKTFTISFNCQKRATTTNYKIHRDLKTETLSAPFIPNYED